MKRAAMIGGLVAAAVVWTGWKPVVERMGSLADVARDPVGNSRYAATMSTWSMFQAAPALGCGFGAFQHVFPRFQDPRIQFGRWLHAHNDWVQLLAEGGYSAVWHSPACFSLSFGRPGVRTGGHRRMGEPLLLGLPWAWLRLPCTAC